MRGSLSESEMDEILYEETFGHMACCEDNKPYIVPMAYVYHDGVLYGQTSEGKKTDILRRNPSVCFQIQRKEGNRWMSVLCHGTFEELEFEELEGHSQTEIVKLLTERIAGIQGNVGIAVPFTFGATAKPADGGKGMSTLFRIVIREKTGIFAHP